MDKTEQLADMVIQAAQVFIDRKLAPILAGYESMKRELDLRGFVTKEDVLGMISAVELVGRDEELREQIRTQQAPPTLEQVRTEASAAALDACTKLLESIPKPADGKSVSMTDVLPEIERLVAEIPRPSNGKDADPQDMAAEVARQIALVPPPVDGKSVDLGAIFTEIGAAVSRAVEALPPPEAGKSVTVEDVRPMLAEMVAAIPAPKDGKDGKDGTNGKDAEPVDLAPIAQWVNNEVSRQMDDRPLPREGKDGLDAIVDYELIESRIRESIPAPIKGDPGKDADLAVLNDMVSDKVKAAMAEFRPPEKGDPGKDAEPLDMEEVRRHLTGEVQRELAGWERPKNGEDGLGFDDMTMDLEDDGRTLVFRVTRDGREKRFEIICPWQIYRDVYEAGRSYTRGDVVTYAGSQFTAKRDTTNKPGTDDWVLSVKRGKDAA